MKRTVSPAVHDFHQRRVPIAKKKFPSVPLREDVEPLATETRTGIVLRVVSGQYIVQEMLEGITTGVHTYRCLLRGNLKKNFTYNTSLSVARRVTKAKRPFTKDTVAIGDRVRFAATDAENGVIEEILPRETRFVRAGFRGQEQTLVTNLDLLVIVFACAEPNPDVWRLDRWLAAAESFEVEPMILANKRELVDEATFQSHFGEFEKIGYRVLAASAHDQVGIEPLREALRGRISAFTGPSGVGKSSLLNALHPGLKLDTGDIGYTTFKGRHTTTVRELIPIESGGWVADTPGLRRLDMLPLEREELAECFREFRPFLERSCRFRDCKHEVEPGCSLREAVDSGAISKRRYESFLAMAQGS